MDLPSHKAVPIGDENLKDWKVVGAGGFGKVYKARHTIWKQDVAIKVPHHGSITAKDGALREAKQMELASHPHVLRLLGVYQGHPLDPRGEHPEKQGLIMEFMERDLQTVQQALCGPPPWPLAFRLAQQVALGMNYLHTLTPPLLHKDLKPSNVMLDDDLNVKLTDFGLSRISTSVTSGRNAKGEDGVGGSLGYMPPEAFDLSYKPVRAYDIYSYGILLWSILTGQEPYPDAKTTLVETLVPRGQRPTLEGINEMADGIGELVDLMKRCWVHEPSERPLFEQCLAVTEPLCSRQSKNEIRTAVTRVLLKLEGSEIDSVPSNRDVPSRVHAQPPAPSHAYLDTVDHAPSFARERKDSPKQDSVATCTVVLCTVLSDTEKATFVDKHRAKCIRGLTNVMAIADDLFDKRMIHPEAYQRIVAKETNTDKVRALYESIRSGHTPVKAAFYDALKEHEEFFMKGLEG